MVAKSHPLQPSWRASTYNDRFDAIAPHLRGRTVLDIGAASGHRRPDWVHAQIDKVAKRVVGIDVDEDAVAAVQARGYDVRLEDAQHLNLDETFDVAFAGELIEHLSNFASFLESVHRHLRPGGLLILTTPNAFCASNFVYRFGFSVRVHHEHTCWFCEDTLTTLLRRCGFEVKEVEYLAHQTPGRVRRLVAGSIRALLPKKLAWRTLMVVAARVEN